MKYLILTIFLLLLNCAETIDRLNLALGHEPYKGQNKAQLKASSPVCDSISSMSDEQFQIYAAHPLRSKEVIKSKLNAINPYLFTYLNAHKDKFAKSSKCTLSLYLPPNGKMKSYLYKDTTGRDSSIYLQARKMLSEISFDSISEYHNTIRISCIYNNLNNSIILDSNIQLTIEQGRSRESIMRVVMANLAELRYAYNARLREKPGIKGKITIKYSINETGTIDSSKVIESTANDLKLETTVADKISKWKFCPIHNKGDITEVIYPFIFTQ